MNECRHNLTEIKKSPFFEVFSLKMVFAHKKALPLHSKRLNNE